MVALLLIAETVPVVENYEKVEEAEPNVTGKSINSI